LPIGRLPAYTAAGARINMEVLVNVREMSSTARFKINDLVHAGTAPAGLPRIATVIRVCNFDGRWKYVLEANSRIVGMFYEDDLRATAEKSESW
jgi:hypothetical protein